jgi:hypothetical protein
LEDWLEPINYDGGRGGDDDSSFVKTPRANADKYSMKLRSVIKVKETNLSESSTKRKSIGGGTKVKLEDDNFDYGGPSVKLGSKRRRSQRESISYENREAPATASSPAESLTFSPSSSTTRNYPSFSPKNNATSSMRIESNDRIASLSKEIGDISQSVDANHSELFANACRSIQDAFLAIQHCLDDDYCRNILQASFALQMCEQYLFQPPLLHISIAYFNLTFQLHISNTHFKYTF